MDSSELEMSREFILEHPPFRLETHFSRSQLNLHLQPMIIFQIKLSSKCSGHINIGHCSRPKAGDL